MTLLIIYGPVFLFFLPQFSLVEEEEQLLGIKILCYWIVLGSKNHTSEEVKHAETVRDLDIQILEFMICI